MIRGQHQFCGDHVFTQRAHGRPRRDRRANLDVRLVDRVDVLDHDHRVGPGGQRIAGIDVLGLCANFQAQRIRFVGRQRIDGAHCVTVHGAGVVGRR